MDILKQNTAVAIIMGPMLNSTDGNTVETGLTISQADIRVSKNGGTYTQSDNTAGATHMEFGKYSVPLNIADTNTLGKIRVDIHESGSLAVWREFTVVTANAYDSLCSTDVFDVNVVSEANIDFGVLKKASINTEVADVFKVDTIVEMAQGALPASPTMEEILNYLYRNLRNKSVTTTSETAVYNDAGTDKIFKASISYNEPTTTFTKDEYGTGA